MMYDQVPFQTPDLVWDSSIAIYLFLLGVASGSSLLALIYKYTHKLAKPSENWIIRAAAFLAPVSVTVGLLLLIFHLARPWTFWFLMFNYQFDSVMSMGVAMFQIYMALAFLWIAVIFRDEIASLIKRYIPALGFINGIIDVAVRFTTAIEVLFFIFNILLGVYTGFLLSDLISYPMLNNGVLPYLFLASGTSSGIAALMICVLVFGKLSAHSDESHFLHKMELPTVIVEAILLVAFFGVLYSAGGDSALSADNALSGFWGMVFWGGVVAIGMLFPQVANLIAGKSLKQNRGFMVFLALAGLFGVVCLRYFILYAGQLTIAS
ncbi:NrfD protein [Bibersteinia trehalosi USDA-ARS-USMARC-190]|uniref:NrfD protein n=2 Tax=Bibersteinia trehalosi TaxID=47735 RepID=W0R5M2_BIBTR|nr:NrfD protein [Bibersteinia trehalosi USDA-ARS-USMARC-190]